ncbi:MAG TPA: type II secretion system F family protein [Bryobacteraceae bacterium]|jgi:tight adherence protein B|nr:type II secretion system F family protein [Bryobacteraceae bacterium]
MSLMLAGVFLLVFALIMAVAVFGFLYRQQHRQKVVKDMLQTVVGNRPLPVTKLLKDLAPEVSGFSRMLKSMNLADHLQSSIRQAGLTWSPSTLFMMTVGAAVPGFLFGLRFPFIINEVLTCLILAGATASLPYVFMRKKRSKRLAALEEQFPEALDFLARSVRAGHAFLISLSMVGEHVPEPLSTELRTLFNEINLGAPLATALENLTIRVPLLDFKFFTSTILLQRQTGGNLNEILGRLAHVIRERFRLKGEVKAASAHGRLTAGILTVLPLLTGLALLAVAPGYLQGMAKDPDGKYMIVAAGVAVLLGNYFIRRIIKIKV